MEDSWRLQAEIPSPKFPNYPPRRSTGYTTTSGQLRPTISDDFLIPEDFTDVFGGPPRTILSHQFPTTGCFYEDIFLQPEKAAPAVKRKGRSLPLFSIPPGKQSNSDRYQRSRRKNGFLGDIFGWDVERVVTSGSISKTSSSSALSSEELSPLRPAVSDDGYDDFSLFASKLRHVPINVKSRWDSTRIGHEVHQTFSDSHPIPNSENDILDDLKNYPFRFSGRNEFPESMNLEQTENSSFKVFSDDLQFNSPASVVSSVSQADKDMETCETEDEILGQDNMEEDEDELMSSYVIEINSGFRETECESNGVDEAIAWAKESFQKHCSEEKPTQEMINEHHLSEGPVVDVPASEDEMSKIEKEMQLLDAKIRLWSTGKEADVRLLLSTLHHILWPNSGWLPISMTNLMESSQVKKAYQKAVLRLHPDKLQQRGATPQQKYIAEKAFSALQDAWATFVSMDVFYR